LTAAGFAGDAPARTGFSSTGAGLTWLVLGVAELAAGTGLEVAKPAGTREDDPPRE
jgi:hypothetical protein